MRDMYVRVNEKLMVRLLDLISKDGTSVHKLCCKTGSDYRTIKKCLQLIVQVQNAPMLKLEQNGLRVVVRWEK